MSRLAPSPITSEYLDQWVEAFRGPLVGLIASWGMDWADAEELAADTFAEAWMGRGRFAGDPAELGTVGAWLRGIALNLFRSARRKRRFLRAVPEDLPMPAAEEADVRQEQLSEAFGELSQVHQNVLRMYYLEETGTQEVAALLDLKPKAVENRLYQARKALRGKLATKGSVEVKP